MQHSLISGDTNDHFKWVLGTSPSLKGLCTCILNTSRPWLLLDSSTSTKYFKLNSQRLHMTWHFMPNRKYFLHIQGKKQAQQYSKIIKK